MNPMQLETPQDSKWQNYLLRARHTVVTQTSLELRGTLTRLTGMVL